MGALAEVLVTNVYHYTPLHYLTFIARAKSLLSKSSINAAGFPAKHLRSKSNAQDVARGFGAYTHLTLDPHPKILRAKLAAGFPHVQIVVPTHSVESAEYSLCRFNVAMTRYLRRDGKPGFPESPTNGRYYEGHQIPVARTAADKAAMLHEHLAAGTMIEVLIHGDLPLSDDTGVVCFSAADADIAQRVLQETNSSWTLSVVAPPEPYPRRADYVEAVEQFVDRALGDAGWRGNGLEFDRV
jgi:hypothetical protein